MTNDVEYRLHPGPPEELSVLAERFRAALFPTLPADFIRSRLPFVADPQLGLAERHGRPVGFKLAYRTSDTTLFSWLGGVLPEARRGGIATGLMGFQHERARSLGYGTIETRTRTTNTAMLILNLRHGFEIVGLETDAHGRFVAIQRKTLERSAPSS